MRSECQKDLLLPCRGELARRVHRKTFSESTFRPRQRSLPPVGGHVTARTDAFNFEEIISCRSAYTKVSGRRVAEDGPWWALVTSVVEGLNILEVVTAERIVAQVAVEHPVARFFANSLYRLSFRAAPDRWLRCISQVQSGSVGECSRSSPEADHLAAFSGDWQQQAAKLIKSVEDGANPDAFRWLIDRYGWRTPSENWGKTDFFYVRWWMAWSRKSRAGRLPTSWIFRILAGSFSGR